MSRAKVVSIPSASEERERIKREAEDNRVESPVWQKDAALEWFLRCPQLLAAFGASGSLTKWDVRLGQPVIGSKPLSDELVQTVRSWFIHNAAIPTKTGDRASYVPSKEALRDELKRIAWENERDSFADYVRSCEGADEPGVWHELASVLGFEPKNPGEATLVCQYLRLQLIGSVARTLNPGAESKVDTCLVLAGAQGKRKTTALKTLFGAPNVCTSFSDWRSREHVLMLSRYACVELGELKGIKGKELETVKQGLTNECDDVTFKYEAFAKQFYRRAVFFGTTNETDFLSDSTGHRRFWVVRVTHQIDLKRLREIRGAVWGAARAAYGAGEKWWLDESEEEAHAEQVKEFTEDDELDEKVASCVLGEEEVKLLEVYARAFGDSAEDMPGQREQKRVAASLRRVGWDVGPDSKGYKVWRRRAQV